MKDQGNIFFDQIESDLKQSLLKRDGFVSDTLKLLKSDILAKAKVSGRDRPNDDDCFLVITQQAKSYRQVAELYDQSNQTEAAANKRQEAAIIEKFLPDRLTDSELDEIVTKVIEDNDHSSFGGLMAIVRSQVGYRSTAAEISRLIKEKLRHLEVVD